ncbi:MAG: putative sugar O-methyltransferase, partial [Actinomycetota bacterium]
PPVAAVATYYLSELFGEDRVWSYLDHRNDEAIDLDAARQRYTAVVLCPWQLPRVTGSVDLFVNMMSFQEMEPDVVANYIDLVSPRTRRFVVLRNSVTGKPRSEAGRLGVDEPVRDDDAIDAFREFEVLARDSFVHGEESPDRSFRSEVAVLARSR